MFTSRSTSKRCTASALALALLAACGGGGDSPPSSALSGAASGAAGAGATPSATPSSPAGAPAAADCGLSNFASDVLARINQLRAAGASCGARGTFAPTTALTWAPLLTQAGEGHSRDMARLNYFSHTSADGRDLADRVNASGYLWNTIGENIAAGYATVDSVMDGWIASDGHCANLMNPSFTQVGVACVPGTATSSYNTYWTMDLGRPQ
ncbi:MAG: hypothetical protein AD742_08935 [Methylibium sp. NZG]|nr:MAG: hypothetical protein AD742_08935 [Methylibium sp. NZG]